MYIFEKLKELFEDFLLYIIMSVLWTTRLSDLSRYAKLIKLYSKFLILGSMKA